MKKMRSIWTMLTLVIALTCTMTTTAWATLGESDFTVTGGTYDADYTETADSLFTDVDSEDAFYDAVKWAVENGIASGYSDGSFDPNGIINRAQAVTFMWRAAGEPEVNVDEASAAITDVESGAYYYNAMVWAVENGITLGTTDTTFGPNTDCSRANIVTFLWRMEGEGIVNSLNLFTDVGVNAYYYNAVLWAVGEGITTGTTDTTFSPNTDCTRAEIITFLYRTLGE